MKMNFEKIEKYIHITTDNDDIGDVIVPFEILAIKKSFKLWLLLYQTVYLKKKELCCIEYF